MSRIQRALVNEFDSRRNAELLFDLKQSIALQVALQSGVLKECALHRQVFYGDQDPKPAFELMLEKFEQNFPEVARFRHDFHELTDMLSEVIAQAPAYCLQCRSRKLYGWETALP